jgi:hypothetical protein
VIHKDRLRPDRLRQGSVGFTWVERWLVRHDYLHHTDPRACVPYVFLVTVGDVHGLGYYSDAAIARHPINRSAQCFDGHQNGHQWSTGEQCRSTGGL